MEPANDCAIHDMVAILERILPVLSIPVAIEIQEAAADCRGMLLACHDTACNQYSGPLASRQDH